MREASQIESSLGPEDRSVDISQVEGVDTDLLSQHRHNDHVGAYSTYAKHLLRLYVPSTTSMIWQLLDQDIWREDGKARGGVRG